MSDPICLLYHVSLDSSSVVSTKIPARWLEGSDVLPGSVVRVSALAATGGGSKVVVSNTGYSSHRSSVVIYI